MEILTNRTLYEGGKPRKGAACSNRKIGIDLGTTNSCVAVMDGSDGSANPGGGLRDQGATGDDLYKRIENLGEKIVLPQGMIKALHNLRLLGNDAVHVEARVYADVGKRQVEVAVDVAKTILQATYQMDTILGELESLKASAGEAEAAQTRRRRSSCCEKTARAIRRQAGLR